MTPMWISMVVTVVIRVPLAYGLASDQNAGAAKRTISGTLDFHAGKLVHGCASDADFL